MNVSEMIKQIKATTGFSGDKVLHFLGGAAIGVSIVCFGGSIGASILAAAAIGLAKEAWDAFGHGTPDVADFAVTALGGLFGAVAASHFQV